MNTDIIIVGSFVIIVMILCKLWNILMMRQYDKAKAVKMNKFSAGYEVYTSSFDKLKLASIGNERNTDFEFIQAVRKIDMSSDVRIKIILPE